MRRYKLIFLLNDKKQRGKEMKAKGISHDNQTSRAKNGLKTKVVLLLAMCIISGCSTVGVYSDPSGAKIFINDNDTGKITPSLIGARSLRTGRSYITVEKEGYKTLTKRQSVDVRISVANILLSWWPPVLIKNLFGNLWKGIINPHARQLEEFNLQKITDQK